VKRLVFVTVGTSLIEKNLDRHALVQSVGSLRAIAGQLDLLRDHLRECLAEIHWREDAEPDSDYRRETVTRYACYAKLARNLPGYQQAAKTGALIVQGMRDLWGTQGIVDARLRRKASSAELASLSLLDPPLGANDEVVLLYSDTPAGAYCAACLEKLLSKGLPGVTEGGGSVHVVSQRIAWLDPERKDAFERQAVGNLALTISEAYYAPREVPLTEALINVTGGYKAAIPILTVIAGLLPKTQIVCLFEESEQLLHQPVVPTTLPKDLCDWLMDPKLPEHQTAESLLGAIDRDRHIYVERSDPPTLNSLGLAVRGALKAGLYDALRHSG